MKAALLLLAEERQRQQSVLGWTEAHDDERNDGALAQAAACYAMAWEHRNLWLARQRTVLEAMWPWDGQGLLNPTRAPQDRVRELVKAGALIVAEIERLHRAARGRQHA